MEKNEKMNEQKKSYLMPVWNGIMTALVIGLLCQSFWGGRAKQAEESTNHVTKYTLYIGLNDKDSYVQEIPTEKAREIVNQICIKNTGGYTTMDAHGGWVDESDHLVEENTLCYVLTEIEEEKVQTIMDEVLTALNQNSILLEKNEAEMVYYSHTGEKE